MKQKQKNQKKRLIIATVIYLILMLSLILLRFPVTVDHVVAYYQGDLAQAQNPDTGLPIVDLEGHPVTNQVAFNYDQGKGYQYEQKNKIVDNEILGDISASGEIDFQIYQDGDMSLPTNLNTLNAKMKSFRFTVRNSEVVLKALSFQKGDKVQFVLSGEELLRYAEASGDLAVRETENGVMLSSAFEGYLDLSTASGGIYHKLFHRFSIVNIILMVIFTVIYLLIAQGHKIMEKFEQGFSH